MAVQLRRDEAAASPLMVIATVVLVASGITALLFFALVDTAPSALSLQETREGGVPAFRVVSTHGGLDWEELGVRFVDPAGVDQTRLLLHLPNGTVDPDDVITLRTAPPPGVYHLRIYLEDRELERVTFQA